MVWFDGSGWQWLLDQRGLAMLVGEGKVQDDLFDGMMVSFSPYIM